MANPSQSGNWPLKCVCPPETSNNNAIIFVDIKLCPQYAICYHFIRQQGQKAWRPLANTLENLTTCFNTAPMSTPPMQFANVGKHDVIHNAGST